MLSPSWILNHSVKRQMLALTFYMLLTSETDTWPWSSGHNVPWALQEQSISLLLRPATQTTKSCPTDTSITFTQTSWKRSSRESDDVYTDIKKEGWSEIMRTRRKEKQIVSKKCLGFHPLQIFTLREHSILLVWDEQMVRAHFWPYTYSCCFK